MSKPQTFGIIIHPSEVISFKDMNLARLSGDYGDIKELVDGLYSYGWLQDDNGLIRVRKLPASLKERAYTARLQEWENYKTEAKLDPQKSTALVVFEEIYVKNGELKPVNYLAVTGNRRLTAFMPANIKRRLSSTADKPLPLIDTIPVMVLADMTDAQLLKSQIEENILKMRGARKPSDVDNLLAAKALIEQGYNQSDLRQIFKDGMGQKYYGIVTLNRMWPNLRIIARMCQSPGTNDAPNPEYINLASVSHAPLANLILRSDPVRLEEKNRKLEIDGQSPMIAATEETIANFFAAPNANAPVKVMDGKKIRDWSENTSVDVVKDTLVGIVNASNATAAWMTEGSNPLCLNATAKILKHHLSGHETFAKFAVAFASADDAKRAAYVKALDALLK